MDKEGLIKFGNKNVDQTVDSLIYDELRDSFKHLRISNLIEFGRMVHAEMAALMEAARRGLAVNRGKLVCTTFPCHMCARHIISAGIREVYYIEPYPKSLVAEMYRDEIEIDSGGTVTVGNETKISKVYFHSFFGVAPRFFSRCFTMRSRKDTRGYTLPFVEQLAIPPMIPLARSHLAPELVVAQTMEFVPKVSDFAKVAPNA